MFKKWLKKLFGKKVELPEKKEETTLPVNPQVPEITFPKDQFQLEVAFKVASTQIGQKEVVGSKHNPNVIEYHQACTLQASDDETAWCSSFVNWCYIIAGMIINPSAMTKLLKNSKYEDRDILLFQLSAIDANNILQIQDPLVLKSISNSGATVGLGTRSALARSWLTFGYKTKQPKVGDIVVFKRGNNGVSGHVGFVFKEEIGSIQVLGGNQGNQVSVKSYSKDDLLGYICQESNRQDEENFKTPNFVKLWNSCSLDPELSKNDYIKKVVDKMIAQRSDLDKLQAITKLPWFFHGALHFREASQDPAKQFMNGQEWNKKTTIVPIGKGPFKSFVDAGVYGYEYKKIEFRDYTIPELLEIAEKWNGLGYRKRGVYSPYVWSFTNKSLERGGYPRDHVWSDSYEHKRPGIASIIKYMQINNLI